VQQATLRVSDSGCQPRFELRIERFALLLCASLQTKIVRNAKDPRSPIVNQFSFPERGIKPEKNLLRDLLRLGRMQAKRQQIPVNIVARLFEQLRYLVPQSHDTPSLPDKPRKLLTERIGRHEPLPKTRPRAFLLHPWANIFPNRV